MKGLRQVVVAAALEGLDALDRVRSGSAQHDHRHLAVPAPSRLTFAQAPAELGRRGVRQLIPHQNKIRGGLLGQAQGFVTGPGADHRETRPRELALEQPANLRLRLGEKDCSAHADEATRPASAKTVSVLALFAADSCQAFPSRP